MVVAAAGARWNTRASFQPTRLVWSRGFALLCDRNGGFDYVRLQRGGGHAALPFDPGAYDDIREGDLVWVRLTSLPQFVDEVLPNVAARFALVTGDEDVSLPSEFARAAAITGNPHVVCWFSQNCDGTDTSGKIFPLPIGIDFHTISNRRKWRHWQATPAQQEAELDCLRARMLPNRDRLLRAHADFHFNMRQENPHGETRSAVYAALRENSNVGFQRQQVSRTALWREKTRYAFVVSPQGHGLDCHRTWESLALGNIPIVKHSPLDPLFDGLPVVRVSSWDAITLENLRDWHAEHRGSFENPEVQERLTAGHWIARIRRAMTERIAGGGVGYSAPRAHANRA